MQPPPPPNRPRILTKHALTWAALGLVLAGPSCRNVTPAVTGLNVVSNWLNVTVDQLEVSVQEEPLGKDLVGTQRQPQIAHGPLTTGGNIIIYFPDSADKTMVRCQIRGFSAGVPVAGGQARANVVKGTLVPVVVDLTAGAGVTLAEAPNGRACTLGTECASHSCSQGVCCSTPCVGLCQSCNVPGLQGTCSFVPAGLPPLPPDRICTGYGAETCSFDGTCDGAGGCRKHPAGTRCSPGVCGDGEITAPGACDGAGQCSAGPAIICAPFRCQTVAGTPGCANTCAASADCIPGRECVNGSCGKKFDGAQCAGGGECASGFCANGVCCDTRCDGACLSCSQVGSPGKCKPIAAGIKDPNKVCMDTGAATCGTTGACDGNGACARYPAGAVCQMPSCMGATILLSAGKCDGLGACQPGAQLACAPYACKNGACKADCAANDDCAPQRTCDVANKSCGKKGLGQSCTAAASCDSGNCVDGVCCDGACAGPCRTCTGGVLPGTCTPVPTGRPDPRAVCTNQGSSTCGTDGTCNGAGVCRKYPIGTVCAAATCATTTTRTQPSTCDASGRCAAGAVLSCGVYHCSGSSCLASCTSDANCAAPNVCVGGTCGLRAVGATCTRSSECKTGSCTNGVCCQAMTCATCTACNIAGSVGTCASIPTGVADARGGCAMGTPNSCRNDGTCNGAGACRRYIAGTGCMGAACEANGLTLTQSSVCDGKGSCPMGAAKTCAPYACDANKNACRTTCTSSADCAPPNLCSGGTCGNFLGLGRPCTSGGQCASGNCVDGVCCAASACGSCLACNVAASPGTCTAIPAGSADPRMMCAVAAATTCGTDGKCDGNGACRKYPAGTVCAAGACAGSVATPPSTCDGSGMCTAPSATIACSPYRCASGVCPTTCMNDTDCVAPASCVGTTCQLKPLAATCTADAQCTGGHCVDGNCCDTGACGKCRACNVTGFAGSCHPLIAGAAEPNGMCPADDATTCKQDGTCDGAGACRLYLAGTACVASSCVNANMMVNTKTCDGAGVCQDKGQTMCAPYTCDATTGACRTVCRDNMDCCCAAACQPSNICQ